MKHLLACVWLYCFLHLAQYECAVTAIPPTTLDDRHDHLRNEVSMTAASQASSNSTATETPRSKPESRFIKAHARVKRNLQKVSTVEGNSQEASVAVKGTIAIPSWIKVIDKESLRARRRVKRV